MNENKPFLVPERQSKVGILLIFLSTFYKSVRGLWIFGLYLFVGDNKKETLLYVLLGLAIFSIGLLIFSIFSYKKFKFHIDYQQKEFVLQKGVFSTEFINLPFDKIQQVYFKRSILQRIIDVYEVVVDTAGSSKKEITIKALSKEKADALREILMDLASEEITAETNTEERENSSEEILQEPAKKVEWKHKLDMFTLLKLGLTSNYLRGVWLIFIFFGTIMNELNQLAIENSYIEDGANYVADNFSTGTGIIFIGVLAIIATFLVGIVISTIEIFLKYFNLTLTQTQNSLDLEMGLKTNTRTSLKPRRVQLMRFSTNPIQKKLNLYEAEISIASSTDQLQKSKIKIPGLEKEKLSLIKQFLYNKPEEEAQKHKPDALLLVRRMMLSLLPLLAAFIPVFIFSWYQWAILIPVILIYLVLAFVLNKKYYHSVSIQFTENFIVKKHGIWNQETEIIQLYKLQSISVSQPFWFRKRGLFNLTFHTAGGDLSFPLIKEELLQQLNYSFYKIETSNKAWM